MCRKTKKKKRLQKLIPSCGSTLLLVLVLWREISLKFLIFPFRNLSALLPCNEAPDSQCMNHPGNESHTPCYEEEWEDKWKPVQWRFKSLMWFWAVSIMSRAGVYLSLPLKNLWSPWIPSYLTLVSNGLSKWRLFTPSGSHMSLWNVWGGCGIKGHAPRLFGPKPCGVLVPLLIQLLPSHCFD